VPLFTILLYARLVKILTLPSDLNEPRYAIAVEDELGRRIFTVGSYLQERNPCYANRDEVFCEIEDLPLGAGKYLISVSVASKYDGLLDSIDGAAWFYVDWDNSYGNGESYRSVYGPALVKSTWR
jgi:hypothetical protein